MGSEIPDNCLNNKDPFRDVFLRWNEMWANVPGCNFSAFMPAELCQDSRLLNWTVLDACWPYFREMVHHIKSGFSGLVCYRALCQDSSVPEALNLY